MSLTRIVALSFAFALACCCVQPNGILAQTRNSVVAPQDDHDQTLKQLLTEVRALRLALQRATVSNTRFQMLIERVRVEQTHVDVVRRDLEGIRSQVSEMQSAKPRMEQQIKEAEDGLDRVTDPNARADVESRIKAMKAGFGRIAPEEERLRNREAVLDSEFQASQARLNELNSQLDALMNELKGP